MQSRTIAGRRVCGAVAAGASPTGGSMVTGRLRVPLRVLSLALYSAFVAGTGGPASTRGE